MEGGRPQHNFVKMGGHFVRKIWLKVFYHVFVDTPFFEKWKEKAYATFQPVLEIAKQHILEL
jgi:hypothetical protein